MKEKLRRVFYSKILLQIMGLLLLLECGLGILVKVKSGNLDSYLALVIPILGVSLDGISYTLYQKGNYVFTTLCLILLQIGITMQCLIQTDDFAGKEQIIFVISLFAAGALIAVHKYLLVRVNGDKITNIIVILTIAIYLLLLVAGTTVQGTKAWLRIGGLSLQLTEFIKILFIYYNAIIFCQLELGDKSKIIRSGLYLGINLIFSLLISEMGSAMIMTLVYIVFCILFLDSAKSLLWLSAGVAGIGAAGLGTGLLIMKIVDCFENAPSFFIKLSLVIEKIASRITIWLHPETDPLGKGYQGMKAKEAMVLGGWFGSDYRISIPIEKSDFVFTSILLNMGLIAGILVVILFIGILILGIKMYLSSQSDLERGILAGAVFYLFLSSLIMILGSTGFFVMTGVPIAFISDGGTAMMTSFMMVGIIISCQGTKQTTTQHTLFNEVDIVREG